MPPPGTKPTRTNITPDGLRCTTMRHRIRTPEDVIIVAGFRRCAGCRRANQRRWAAEKALRAEARTYIDKVAVQRAIDGEPVTLTKAEKHLAVALATARGMSAALIAERLGTTQRLVQRYRAIQRAA